MARYHDEDGYDAEDDGPVDVPLGLEHDLYAAQIRGLLAAGWPEGITVGG